MYLDVFSQISTIFLYYFISFTSISIWKARTTVALLHERQQPLVSFYFFVLFQIVWHFLRSNDLLSICRSVECNMPSMCRMRCMCFISIRCFFSGNVSRLLWQLSRSLRGSRSASSKRSATEVKHMYEIIAAACACGWMCIVQHHISMSSQWIEIVSLFSGDNNVFHVFFSKKKFLETWTKKKIEVQQLKWKFFIARAHSQHTSAFICYWMMHIVQ